MHLEVRAGGASSYLNFDLLVTEQGHQMWDDAGVDDHLDLLVPGIGQVRQSPDRVDQDLPDTKKKKKLFFSAAWANLGSCIDKTFSKGTPQSLAEQKKKNGITRCTHADVGVIYQHTQSRQDLGREKTDKKGHKEEKFSRIRVLLLLFFFFI